MANVNTANGFAAGLPAYVNVIAEAAFPVITGGTIRAVAGIHQDFAASGNPGSYDGKLFRVRACYVVTGGTTTNFTLKIYCNKGGNTDLTTFTNDTSIASSGAVAVNSATKPFCVEAVCMWDSVSATINGAFNIMAANTYTGFAALSNQVTAITNQTGLQFFATGLFSATNAGNTVKMTEFVVEQV